MRDSVQCIKEKLQNEATCMCPPHSIARLTLSFPYSDLFISHCRQNEASRTHLSSPVGSNQPPLLTAYFVASLLMSSLYLSVALSSLDVFVTVIQLVVSAWRLHHERTRRAEITADTRSNRKLWLQMGMCLVLAILGILLLVFSRFRPDEKAIEVLLSLVGASLIVYQVSC